MAAKIIEIFYDGRPDVIVQDGPTLADGPLDPLALSCLADWFIAVGRRLGKIDDRNQWTVKAARAHERGLTAVDLVGHVSLQEGGVNL